MYKYLILLNALLVVLGVIGCLQSEDTKNKIDLSAIKSPIIFRGDSVTAFRDPTALYHDGVFWLYFTYNQTGQNGQPYWTTALSKSSDLVSWSEPRSITPKDLHLNYSSPGNIIRFENDWILCLQTYPTPNREKYGNEDARIWIMRSKDLENWGPAELLRVKGPDVPREEMGRLIDAYLIEDKDESGKWYCFFDDDAVNISSSYDLKSWTYLGRYPGGENVCVLVKDDEYIMFHSPKNGIGIKRSTDLRNWRDEAQLITLGQKNWHWAQGRLSAAFVLDLTDNPDVGKYLMFFHGSGPLDERFMFTTRASLGIAWSENLITWQWPGK